MDSGTRTAIVAAVATVVGASISAYATISVAGADLKRATAQATSDAASARSTLNRAGSLLRHVYDNGSITETELVGGKMVVRVNGSHNGGAVSYPLDMNRFEQLCGDADGCVLTLGATRFRIQKGGHAVPGYVIEPPLQGASCHFFWDMKTRSWTLSQFCVAIFGLYKYSGKPPSNYEYDRAYQVAEYSSTFGHDDSNHNGQDTDGQSLIIMGFKGACYLTEAAPDQRHNNGSLLADSADEPGTGRGLYLVASSPTWDFPGAYPHDDSGGQGLWPPNDPARRCELIIED